MTIDEIRKLHYEQKGKEEERKMIQSKEFEKAKKLLIRRFGPIDELLINKLRESSYEVLDYIVNELIDSNINSINEVDKYLNK